MPLPKISKGKISREEILCEKAGKATHKNKKAAAVSFFKTVLSPYGIKYKYSCHEIKEEKPREKSVDGFGSRILYWTCSRTRLVFEQLY
ncbi:MAG: hypothetical protein LBT39_07620, partial [Treponema sp.]|jgi:hypothetical protein|nr:hypothetical protein [Treponema sp.]